MAILKQFCAKDRAATGAYLIGADRDSEAPDYRAPIVLIGDPLRFDEFVATIPHAQPVTALVLSFNEALDEHRLLHHAESLVAALSAGIPATRFEVTAVAHRERAGPKKKRASTPVTLGAQACTYCSPTNT